MANKLFLICDGSLFGIVVGAGILFLYIRAGSGGFCVVMAMCVIIFPMVWLSQTHLVAFCQSDWINIPL